jgi:RimJ/RimL family protein N-acetyltransferase
VAWLERTLASAQSRLWIAEQEGAAVGQFRADGAGTGARISYSIAHDFRGRGLAARLLRAGAALACEELNVERVDGVVKESNVWSCRAFERAGFTLAARLEERGSPCRRYEWRRDGR